jgi:hypothetical protein
MKWPSFLATVFLAASAFNGDLNKWDVSKVTTINSSKSIRIFENDLTWHEHTVLIGGFPRGSGWWRVCDAKAFMGECRGKG